MEHELELIAYQG